MKIRMTEQIRRIPSPESITFFLPILSEILPPMMEKRTYTIFESATIRGINWNEIKSLALKIKKAKSMEANSANAIMTTRLTNFLFMVIEFGLCSNFSRSRLISFARITKTIAMMPGIKERPIMNW